MLSRFFYLRLGFYFIRSATTRIVNIRGTKYAQPDKVNKQEFEVALSAQETIMCSSHCGFNKLMDYKVHSFPSTNFYRGDHVM